MVWLYPLKGGENGSFNQYKHAIYSRQFKRSAFFKLLLISPNLCYYLAI